MCLFLLFPPSFPLSLGSLPSSFLAIILFALQLLPSLSSSSHTLALIDHCVYLYTLSVSVCVCVYIHVHLHVIRCNNSIYTLPFLFFSLSPSLPPFLSLSLSPSYNVLNAFPTNTILCTCTCSYLIMHYSFIHSLTLLSHSLTHLSYSLIDPH